MQNVDLGKRSLKHCNLAVDSRSWMQFVSSKKRFYCALFERRLLGLAHGAYTWWALWGSFSSFSTFLHGTIFLLSFSGHKLKDFADHTPFWCCCLTKKCVVHFKWRFDWIWCLSAWLSAYWLFASLFVPLSWFALFDILPDCVGRVRR